MRLNFVIEIFRLFFYNEAIRVILFRNLAGGLVELYMAIKEYSRKKFDGYLLCTDLDGTLTNSGGEISKRNFEAINYFEDNGGIFIMATGRFPKYVRKFQELLNSSPLVIALNGTMIYDLAGDKIIYSSCLNDNAAQVLDYVNENFGFVKEILIHTASESFIYGKENTAGGSCPEYPKPWYKILFIQNADKSILLEEKLMERFGHEYNFNRSWAEGIEMIGRESGKGECIFKLKKILNREIHTTVCVGDYENDISMIKMADNGFAVQNAIDEVKQIADFITVSNNDDAIAHIIYGLQV